MTILRQFKFPLESIFLNMLFTFHPLACFRRLFPATTRLDFQTPRTELGPLRLLKTSEPGSLSHIRTKLFWVYLLRLILKKFKRQDRSHITADGRSVFASSLSWGARPDLCVVNITARQSWGAVPDCSVSLSTVVSHSLFRLYTFPIFHTHSTGYRSFRQYRPHTRVIPWAILRFQ